jgi:hypothetical protein
MNSTKNIETTVLCQALKADNISKCRNFALKGSTFCGIHLPDSPYVCQGTTRDGRKCKARKAKKSDYCCKDHDPSNERSTDPSIFRIPDLRNDRMSAVMEYRNNMDLFSQELIDMDKDADRVHLEHHVEMNLGRDAYDSLRPTNMKLVDAEKLRDNIKITFNENFNLSFTDRTVNQKKTAAMQNFADDYKADKVKGGLEYYVLESFHMATRGKTANIIKEVTNSFDSIVDHMTNTHETSNTNTLYVEKLEDMMAAMKLA